MKINKRLGALRVPFFMMIGFACVTFSQVYTASAQTAQPGAPGGPGQTTWLLNAVFADGGTATGRFTLNSGYTALTAWNIQVSADVKDKKYTAFTYSNTAGGFQLVLPNLDGDAVYSVFSSTLSRGLALAFSKPLQNSGGFEKLIANPNAFVTSEEQIVFPKLLSPRFITSGSVTEVAVPEPGTMASFALGMVALMSLALVKQMRSARAIFVSA
jgi:PEP-CTERM motif